MRFDSAMADRQAATVPAKPGTLAEAERAHILAALEASDWRVEGDEGAASVLGLNPSTLRSRMKKHGISRPSTGITG